LTGSDLAASQNRQRFGSTLTASEQEQLLRLAKEIDEYARKAFSQNAPFQTK